MVKTFEVGQQGLDKKLKKSFEELREWGKRWKWGGLGSAMRSRGDGEKVCSGTAGFGQKPEETL